MCIRDSLGGFATPALLSMGEDRPIELFSYLLLLSAGLAWVALRKRWALLSVASLVFTTCYQWGWVVRFLAGENLGLAAGIFLVFPLVFAAGPALASREPGAAGDVFGRTAAVAAALPSLFALYVAGVGAYGEHWGLLFGFLALLDAGLFVLAVFRGLALLHAVGGIATLAVLGAWFVKSMTPDLMEPGLTAAVGFSLFYLFAPALAGRLRENAPLAARLAALGLLGHVLLLFVATQRSLSLPPDPRAAAALALVTVAAGFARRRVGGARGRPRAGPERRHRVRPGRDARALARGRGRGGGRAGALGRRGLGPGQPARVRARGGRRSRARRGRGDHDVARVRRAECHRPSHRARALPCRPLRGGGRVRNSERVSPRGSAGGPGRLRLAARAAAPRPLGSGAHPRRGHLDRLPGPPHRPRQACRALVGAVSSRGFRERRPFPAVSRRARERRRLPPHHRPPSARSRARVGGAPRAPPDARRAARRESRPARSRRRGCARLRDRRDPAPVRARVADAGLGAPRRGPRVAVGAYPAPRARPLVADALRSRLRAPRVQPRRPGLSPANADAGLELVPRGLHRRGRGVLHRVRTLSPDGICSVRRGCPPPARRRDSAPFRPPEPRDR